MKFYIQYHLELFHQIAFSCLKYEFPYLAVISQVVNEDKPQLIL
jgi:hypothetical protein